MTHNIKAILFDLDGTLVDSAPDLVASVGYLRARHGLDPIDLAGLGRLASRGALALIEAGFADRPEIDRELLRGQFLEHYAEHLWQESRIYDGIESLLDSLDAVDLPVAVVTNKATYLAEALIRCAGWSGRFAGLVGGGCTARAKPHPDPVLEACRRLGVAANDAWMIGDDRRDIEAARQAGARAVVAAWGYLAGEDPLDWGAHAIVHTPHELQTIIHAHHE